MNEKPVPCSLPAIPTGEVRLQRIAELVVRGGWPDSVDATLVAARELARSHLDLTVEDDASRIDGVRRDPLGTKVTGTFVPEE